MTSLDSVHSAKRVLQFSSSVLLVVLIAGIACSPTSDPEDGPAGQIALRSRRGTLERRLVLTGTLEAVDNTTLHVPQTTERIITLQWLAQDGAEVQRGDPVAEFDPSPFSAKFETSRNQVLVAGRTLDRLEKEAAAAAEQSDIQWERAKVAFAKAELHTTVPANLRSPQEHENALLAMEQANAALLKSEQDRKAQRAASETQINTQAEDLRAAQRELERAEEAMDVVHLTAPKDGILVIADHPWEGRRIQVGDSLWIGLAVAIIPDLSSMRVRAVLWDVDDGALTTGMDARCTLDAVPNRHFQGRLVDLTPVAQEVRRFSLRRGFNVVLDLDQVDPEVTRPGMSVHVEIPLPSSKNAILIPRHSVVFDGVRTLVILADGTRKEVSLGHCSPKECVVTSDLAEGLEMMRPHRS